VVIFVNVTVKSENEGTILGHSFERNNDFVLDELNEY